MCRSRKMIQKINVRNLEKIAKKYIRISPARARICCLLNFKGTSESQLNTECPV